MFAKYIDENTIEIANKYVILKYDDVQVINPKEEDFIKAGYKELVIEEEPNYDMEKEYLEPTYKELDNKVIQSWVKKEVTEEPAYELYVEEETEK